MQCATALDRRLEPEKPCAERALATGDFEGRDRAGYRARKRSLCDRGIGASRIDAGNPQSRVY